MVTSQEIIYAPQAGDMIVESVFSQTPSVLYQNHLREFWCTDVVEHPTSSSEDSEARPLKESIIKFTMKKVKAELAKIATHDVLVHKTPLLKASFPAAWRILMTFAIQVLIGNNSSMEQLNSSQQLIVYSLLTWTNIDIGEIIYNDLVTRLTTKSRQSTSHPLLEGHPVDPKDSWSNIQLIDEGLPSTLVTGQSGADTKYQVDKTQSTLFEVSD
ncbi:hypothetical protein Tco_0765092 [Tanacetum coccineum]